MPRSSAQGITGRFFGLPVATLQTMLTTWQACLNAIAVAGQSYTISGRQFNRAQIEDVIDAIAEIQAAIDRAQGNRVTQTYAKFTNTNGAFPSGANGSLT